jgi:hypothetical protein
LNITKSCTRTCNTGFSKYGLLTLYSTFKVIKLNLSIPVLNLGDAVATVVPIGLYKAGEANSLLYLLSQLISSWDLNIENLQDLDFNRN